MAAGGQVNRGCPGLDLLPSHSKRSPGLDLLPSHRKKVQREQIWDQRIYAAWLHTLHHPFIRVDAHGAGMSHVPYNYFAVVNLRMLLEN